jgi:VCBS repeat-containing protein
VAVNDTYTTLEDVRLTIAAPGILTNDTDVEGNPLTAVLVGNVTHGTLALNPNGGFTYLSATNYNGSDSFTYRANDGTTNGNVVTVTINITPVYDPVIAVNDSTNTLEDTSVTINVLANDYNPDGLPLTITSTSTTNGTAVISGTNVVFTPSTNFNGIVVFSYTVSDGTNSTTASVTVTVTPVNDAPVANNDTYTTLEDVPLTIPAGGILTNDTDVDGDALTALLESNVAHGSLSLNTDGGFTYTPNTNYYGSDSFTYRATDGLATSAVATVTITILDNTPLSLSSAEMTAGGFSFQLSGPPASTYVIEASTNLTDWTAISTNSGLTGSVVFSDTEAANFSQRYYRALAR